MNADQSRKRKLRKRKLLPLLQAPDASLEPRELPPLPLLLTIPNTGFQLGICERQVYELANKGLLDLVKVGPKSSRITTESVLRVARQRAKPAGHVPGLKQFADMKKEPQPEE